ncbi:hypothetical protein [Flavobacterium sp.]|nr:hypothetical protein [Flavobacterium sp.]
MTKSSIVKTIGDFLYIYDYRDTIGKNWKRLFIAMSNNLGGI